MEVIVAVADEGGFTATARRLHVVHSAVSGTIRALERELGAPTFRPQDPPCCSDLGRRSVRPCCPSGPPGCRTGPGSGRCGERTTA
ncbi:helix-turn-helix domain-containing protein [Streptomyces lancefieldiae]|uniref:LysR family transcriptional regulator n=1 Tax=Streptomyces lancefieldiae TaxID=3075520 RepID=A0ABU3B403_9ACTN|nr:LysR family transcriptional regulator [Streptomyces sp. DSM 40712]MDT0616562.1 LysR family transcriptional regulator [Streptomyces sp. DSM 40712]